MKAIRRANEILAELGYGAGVENQAVRQEFEGSHTLPMESVIAEWKPRFRDSMPPQYRRIKKDMLDKVFNIRGDLDTLGFAASVTVMGKPDPGASWAKEAIAGIKAAEAAGYRQQRVKIDNNTTVIFVKDGDMYTLTGEVLTNEGLAKIQVSGPDARDRTSDIAAPSGKADTAPLSGIPDNSIANPPATGEDTEGGYLAKPNELDAEKIKSSYTHRTMGGLSAPVKVEQEWYVNSVNAFHDSLLPLARNEAQQAKLKELTQAFKDEYRQRRYRVLDMGSSVVSVGVAGGFNFNHGQSARRGNALDHAEGDFSAWVKQAASLAKPALLALRTHKEKANDDRLAEDARVKKLASPIMRDLAMVASIDQDGSGGWDRSAFVNGAVRKIENLHKNGDAAALEQVFAFIADYDAKHKKPLFAQKNKVWQFKPALDSVLDSTTPLARLRQVKELNAIRAERNGLGEGPGIALKRLKLAKRTNEILAKLGAAKNTGGGNASPEPRTAFLQSIAKGEHDSDDLGELFGKIEEAVNGLNADGKLEGAADQAANDALTRWVEILEPKTSA